LGYYFDIKSTIEWLHTVNSFYLIPKATSN
jgi:hypothetical protein